MEELVINGETISFNNPEQIINMGGPWIGELVIGNRKVTDNVVIDNLVYNPEQHKLYFIKYHKVSKWQNENYFSINIIDMHTKESFTYDLKFEQVFIKEIDNSYDLTYYDAFHDQDEKRKNKLNLGTIKFAGS